MLSLDRHLLLKQQTNRSLQLQFVCCVKKYCNLTNTSCLLPCHFLPIYISIGNVLCAGYSSMSSTMFSFTVASPIVASTSIISTDISEGFEDLELVLPPWTKLNTYLSLVLDTYSLNEPTFILIFLLSSYSVLSEWQCELNPHCPFLCSIALVV